MIFPRKKLFHLCEKNSFIFQRLRESIKQPEKIAREVDDKQKNRKRKREKFSSVVKKACKALEDESDDYETKKMRKLLRSNVWDVTQNVNSKPKTKVVEGWTVSDLPAKNVSFLDKTDTIAYDPEYTDSAKPSSVQITVPRSACEDRIDILIPDENYLIVDFKKFEDGQESALDHESVKLCNCVCNPSIQNLQA